MARQTKVVLNRKLFGEIELGLADGMFELAKAVVVGADVPTAAEAHWIKKGVLVGPGGMRHRGWATAFVEGKQVARFATGKGSEKGSLPIGSRRSRIVAAGGYGFPAHLIEFGAIGRAAEPFVTPSLMRERSDTIPFLALGMAQREATKPLVAGIRKAQSAGDEPKARVIGRAIRRIERLNR